MWRTRTAVAMLAGLGGLACDGHYQVGAMGTPASGSGGMMMVMVPKSLGGTSSGGASAGTSSGEPDATCLPSEPPEALDGELAEPEVVWSRLAPVIWGDEAAEPPSALPEVTTATWAAELATQALEQAREARGVVPGASSFIRRWMRYPTEAELDDAWGAALSADQPALAALLGAEQSDPKRVGVFAEQAWLSAYPAISTRGFLMLQALFGQYVPPEPNGLDTDVAPMPGFTRREQIAAHVADPSCASCHTLIDPLGLSLEHFDASGQYRDTDAGQPVDASGTYRLLASGQMISFEDIADLGAKLEESCDANAGLASEFLRLALARTDPAYEAPEPVSEAYETDRARVKRAFIHGGRSYRALVRAYAQSASVLRP
jgi:hypothetical protein